MQKGEKTRGNTQIRRNNNIALLNELFASEGSHFESLLIVDRNNHNRNYKGLLFQLNMQISHQQF